VLPAPPGFWPRAGARGQSLSARGATPPWRHIFPGFVTYSCQAIWTLVEGVEMAAPGGEICLSSPGWHFQLRFDRNVVKFIYSEQFMFFRTQSSLVGFLCDQACDQNCGPALLQKEYFDEVPEM